MNIYEYIVDRLYVWNTNIGDTNFDSPLEFIEAKHLESIDKDFIFYERLLHEMPNHFDPMMRSELFKEIIQYCKRKIDSYKSDYEQPDFIYSISGEPMYFEIKNDEVGQAYKPNEKCRKEHSLDIFNYAIISFKGKVEHPEQNFYDNKFIVAINTKKNKAETIRFINHHYSKAKNKDMFLQKIDSLFERTKKSPIDEVLNQDVRTILLDWYNSKIEKLALLENSPQQTETKNSNTLRRSIAADIVEGLRAEVEMDELFLRAEKVRKEKEGINLPPQQTKTKTNKLKAPVLGMFCSLINKIGVDKKEETESATVYCERICIKYKLPYTDRVRQNYNVNETKKLIQEFNEKVLPLIDNETKSLIQKYLDSKQPPK